MSKSDLVPIDIEADDWHTVLGVLRARVPDRDVWAFGSRANWTAKEFSDLDLAVGGTEPLSLDTLAGLADDFDVLDLPFRVDVLDLASASPEFVSRVATNRIPIQIAAELKFVRLGDVCTKIGSGATPRGGKDVYLEAGPVSLIRSQNIYNAGFRDQGLVYIDLEQARRLANVEVCEDDVLINITGDSVARCCIAPKRHLPARVNQHVAIIRPDTKILSPAFLRFFLVSPTQQERMMGLASSGATRNALTKDMIESFLIPCPPIDEQNAVASVLQAIEERIFTLFRCNDTLEAMAQALFKSWFVDLEPVRAKIEGREPDGMDAQTAALFPDNPILRDGSSPAGWQAATLGSIAEVGIGKTPPRGQAQWFSESSDDVVWVSIRDMGKSGVYIAESAERLTASAIERFNIRIVPDNTVIVSFKLTVGRLAITSGPLATNEAIAHLVLGRDAVVSPEFLYCALSAFNFESLSSTSSIAEAVNSKTIRNISVIVPERQIVDAFTDLAGPLFASIKNNQELAKNLADLRDTLLPRLISGKLRVPEAEKLIGAVL